MRRIYLSKNNNANLFLVISSSYLSNAKLYKDVPSSDDDDDDYLFFVSFQ